MYVLYTLVFYSRTLERDAESSSNTTCSVVVSSLILQTFRLIRVQTIFVVRLVYMVYELTVFSLKAQSFSDPFSSSICDFRRVFVYIIFTANALYSRIE